MQSRSRTTKAQWMAVRSKVLTTTAHLLPQLQHTFDWSGKPSAQHKLGVVRPHLATCGRYMPLEMDLDPAIQQQQQQGAEQQSDIELAPLACLACKKQKRKCDKALPACTLCQRIGSLTVELAGR